MSGLVGDAAVRELLYVAVIPHELTLLNSLGAMRHLLVVRLDCL